MARHEHSGPFVLRALALVVTLAAFPASAAADAYACASRPTPRWVARTSLNFQLVPLGVELQTRAGACVPLVPSDGGWFGLAALEVGVAANATPVYLQSGVYAQLTPISFLSFRLEVLGVGYWPFSLEGEPPVGYLGLGRVDADQGDGTYAGGSTIRGYTTLQAYVPIEPLALLAYDSFSLDRTLLGSQPYFVNLVLDLIQARDDLVVGNDLGVVVEFPFGTDTRFRVGGFHSYRYVLGTGEEWNQVGLVAMAGWVRPIAEIYWMELGIRFGQFESHPRHPDELSLSAWATVEWDLGPI